MQCLTGVKRGFWVHFQPVGLDNTDIDELIAIRNGPCGIVKQPLGRRGANVHAHIRRCMLQRTDDQI